MIKGPQPFCYSVETYICIIIITIFIRTCWFASSGHCKLLLVKKLHLSGIKVIFSWCISWHEKLHLQQTFMFWIRYVQDVADLTNCLHKSSKWDAIHPTVWQERESATVKLWAKGISAPVWATLCSGRPASLSETPRGTQKGHLDPSVTLLLQERGEALINRGSLNRHKTIATGGGQYSG